MDNPNLATSRRWFEKVWNERCTATIEELLSPECVGRMEGVGDLVGIEIFKQVHAQYLAAFPDLKFEVERIVADGDDVVIRWRATGTHAGQGLGMEPTQEPIEVRGITWHRYRDGKMIEGWDSWNQAALVGRLERVALARM